MQAVSIDALIYTLNTAALNDAVCFGLQESVMKSHRIMAVLVIIKCEFKYVSRSVNIFLGTLPAT